MRENRADELERVKLEINLADFAQAKGYQPIKTESSRASVVMRHPDGDKIIVATDQDGHGIYFSVRDPHDNGSIIDFIQKRQGMNLGQVRQELRFWCPSSSSYRRPAQPAAVERLQKPEPTSRDRAQVLATWAGMQPAGQHDYLLQRQLSAETLSDPRFAGSIRRDRRGNAVFPHFDQDGLTGFELKNEGFTGFSKHGEKALWHSSNIQTAPRLVVTESAIDALSFAQMKPDRQAAYISTGGSMSDKQRQLLAHQLADAHARGAEIIVGTDNDLAGDQIADQIKKLAPAGAKIERQRSKLKDWNDDLRAPAEWQKFCDKELADAGQELQQIHCRREELLQMKKLRHQLEERLRLPEPSKETVMRSVKYELAGKAQAEEITRLTGEKLTAWRRRKTATGEQLEEVCEGIKQLEPLVSAAKEKQAQARILAADAARKQLVPEKTEQDGQPDSLLDYFSNQMQKFARQTQQIADQTTKQKRQPGLTI